MSFDRLLRDVRGCAVCETHLPHRPRPVVQANPKARVLVAGQAPGRRVHESGVPFDDPSGDRLREWMGVNRRTFYDPTKVAILPMGFCYPGTGRSGDLPPRSECAPQWREALLTELKGISLTLVIGKYAQAYHLPGDSKTVTETVRAWRDFLPAAIPLPHPSPRNNIWLKKNPWFQAELIPVLRDRISASLAAEV